MKRTGKVKSRYMSGAAFAHVKQALEDAVNFERGDHRDLIVTRIPLPRPQRIDSTGKTSVTMKQRF